MNSDPEKDGTTQKTSTISADKEPIATILANADPAYVSIGTAPLDGNDPLIYSHVLATPPFSFLDPIKQKYNSLMPPPVYLKPEELSYNQMFEKNDILRGFTQPAEGGLNCSDKEVYAKQKGVIGNLLKQVAKGFFQKGGFVRISLPVRVFEARSTLDKIIDAWRMAPTYLTKAAMTTDPVLRMKWVISFAMSGLYCMVTNLKPFNPLLGETLEGGFDDGTLVYCEHTSHHPPVTNFLIKGPGYTMWGRYEYKVEFSANSLKARQAGKHYIQFENGDVVSFKLPAAKLTGLVMGTRSSYYTGELKFLDKQNGLKSVVIMDCGKTGGFFGSRKKGHKKDEFEGLLYKWNPLAPNKKHPNKLSELKDVEAPITKISGSWLSSLKFGDEEFWNIDSCKPCGIWYLPQVLPSDWRFREDLLWLRKDDMQKADLWKIELEVQQRYDRALREKHRPKKD